MNTSTQHVPSFNVDGIFYNWPSKTGNGDKYMHGHNIPVSPVVIRAATELEACPDLREPRFSSCTSPLVLYVRCDACGVLLLMVLPQLKRKP